MIETAARGDRRQRLSDGLRGGSAIAAALGCAMLWGAPAAAQDACGADVSGAVNCTPQGNPYHDGIAYPADGDLHLRIDPGVFVETDEAPGITLSGDASSITVDMDASAQVTTHGAGATGLSVSTGSGAITAAAAGTIVTEGDGARGIDIYSASGPVDVQAGTVRTSGAGADAIHVVGYAGDTSITAGTIAVSGPGSRGIYAASTGAVSVDSGSITVTGDNDSPTTALFAVGYTATTVHSGSIVTDGTDLDGLTVQSIGGDATVTSGTVETQGRNAYGIFGEQFYGGHFDLTSDTVSTAGDGSVGITVIAPEGSVSITSGTVTTLGDGATGITTRYVENGTPMSVGGNIAITSGIVSTAGAGADGIVADSTGGAVSIDSGTVSTAGAGSRGILVSAPARAVAVTSGHITTLGDGATGLSIDAGGDVSVVARGTVSTAGADAPAIRIATTGSATLDLGSTTAVGARSDAISVAADGGSDIALAGTTSAADGAAVRTTGGAVTIRNAGTLAGAVMLGTGDDRLVNTGTFIAADSDFGVGADTLANSDLVTVRAATTTLAGLEIFANSGTISLQNGRIGDRLILPGTLIGSGASRLLVDVGPGGADVLQVGGASGSTVIGLALLGTPTLGTAGTVVEAPAGTAASAFTLDPGLGRQGLVAYGLTYDAATGRFALVGAPGGNAYRTTRLAEGQRSTWYALSDGWSAHMTSVRDARAAGSTARRGGWFAMGGGAARRGGGVGGTFEGVSDAYAGGYRQDDFIALGGYDLIAPSATGGLSAGLLAAYQTSHLEFTGSADKANYQSATGGAYAGWSSGMVFADAIGRYQKSWNTIYGRSAGYTVRRDGDLYGTTGEIGFRLGGSGFFVEPVASIDFVHSTLDPYTAYGARFRFDPDQGLRGKAGARAGTAFAIGATRASIFAAGSAVHEFQGRDRVRMTSGDTTAVLRGDRIGTYGEGRIGFSATMPGGVTGFIEGQGEAGQGYHGGGGRAGLALRF